jgi:hypothetical protein
MSATTIVDISGYLDLVNDSPTRLGSATAFTTTTSLTGTVSFSWDFGDQSTTESGAANVISHTYTAAGIFTATVTAKAGSSELTASSIVMVDGGPPTVTISTPMQGQIIDVTPYTILGTAADDIGLDQVEVSTDGGKTWEGATGTQDWRFVWIVPAEQDNTFTLLARAIDQVGYLAVSQPVEVLVRVRLPYRIYLPAILNGSQLFVGYLPLIVR